MGDFHQNGVVTTLHNFRNYSTENLEAKLCKFSKKRPMALVLPCLYSELDGPALPNIVKELQKVEYLNEIIIGLDRHVEEQAVDLFAQNVYDAGEIFLQQPMHSMFIPSWKRVMSAIPDFMDMFYDAVEKDNG
jgi:hypothetical protein